MLKYLPSVVPNDYHPKSSSKEQKHFRSMKSTLLAVVHFIFTNRTPLSEPMLADSKI